MRELSAFFSEKSSKKDLTNPKKTQIIDLEAKKMFSDPSWSAARGASPQ